MARVLIVEDEFLIAALLDDWLAELGHQAIGPVSTVDGGVKTVGEEQCDAALLDINLGGQRSDAIAELLAERNIPFAFMTGASADSVMARFADRPKLLKPFDFEALGAVLDLLAKRP